MDMKQLRERLGLEIVDIAAKLRKSEATIRFWENGKNTPTIPIAEIPLLLDVYQCTPQELAEAAKETRDKFLSPRQQAI